MRWLACGYGIGCALIRAHRKTGDFRGSIGRTEAVGVGAHGGNAPRLLQQSPNLVAQRVEVVAPDANAFFQQVDRVALLYSPNSTSAAYVRELERGASRPAVTVGDLVYEGPTSFFSFPSFDPTSRHFAAIVSSPPSGWTVMIDGKVGEPYESVIETSSAACRFLDERKFRFYGVKQGQLYRVIVELEK